ncbi:MAG: hypothetical protein HYX62_08615 [Gammaproteobacteria bacterium]|nr:hypothetical protein [Gammaproteobacteria bacterium]
MVNIRTYLLPLVLCVTAYTGCAGAAASSTDKDAAAQSVEAEQHKPFTFRVTGRLRADGAIFDNVRECAGAGCAAVADQTPLENRGELSSARLGISGTAGQHWRYATSYEFTGDEPGFRATTLSYTGLHDTTIKLGLQRESFGMEQATSTRLIPFMERALPEALAPGYNLGAVMQTGGKRWSASGGLFWEDEGLTINRVHSMARGVTGRFTVAPPVSLDTLHLGLSATYREPDARQTTRFLSEPEAALAEVEFVDTHTIVHVDRYNGTNFEGAVAHGPLSLQGEATKTRVMRKSGHEALDFEGGYVYASWLMTGESRPYNAKIGSFERIKPKRKIGAWELALRYSTLDLNDGPIRGGKQSNITAGLNWHITSQWRFMVNYIWVTAHTINRDERPKMLLGRVQYEF